MSMEDRGKAVRQYRMSRVGGLSHADAIKVAHNAVGGSIIEVSSWCSAAKSEFDTKQAVGTEPEKGCEDDLRTASAPEAGQKWSFDSEVTAAFEDMLERSIPNYADMRRAVNSVTELLLQRELTIGMRRPFIVDFGASRGGAVAQAVKAFGDRCDFMLIESSDPMREVLQQRFAQEIETQDLTVRNMDLRRGFSDSPRPITVALSVLTLQFIPIEHRQQLIADVYRQMSSTGAFIVVEKVLGQNAGANALLREVYHASKVEQGYTQEAVDRKALSLEGVLVPITAAMNEQWLRDAGFRTVEVLWAWGPFRAWIALP